MVVENMKIDKLQGIVEELRFDYKGYPCAVLFMNMGHRCGYVGIPNKTYSIDFEEVINCHGGITYGPSDHLRLQEDVDKLWIGFDCAHLNDQFDYEKIVEYFGQETLDRIWGKSRRYYEWASIKTLEYCKNECMRIVDQLIELGV